ncbi:MAG TPA: hypothetical protein VFV93_04140 [Thermomicrobiales bacterium]|nr:hypothetical protein [Thermomicrobiales bacterium]
MQTEQTAPTLDLEGNAKQKELAGRLFRVFEAQGRFFSSNAPIRITLAQLAEFMGQQESGKSDWTKDINAALSASKKVFAREEQDDEVVFVTTRSGRVPVDMVDIDQAHSLGKRFATPEPKRAIPPTRRLKPSRPSPYYIESSYPTTEPSISRSFAPPADDTYVVVPTTLPTHVEPLAEVEDELIPAPPVIEEDIEELAPAPVAETVSGEAIEIASASDEAIVDAIHQSLGQEMSVARWGDLWMMEDKVQRFSRGDLRRIEDFLREQGGIANDEEIVQDILGVRTNADEYAGTRFALNYRLSRETREFEYVGTDTAGVWSLSNQPSIGTTKRKPSEIGQDYRFLIDYRTPDEGLEEGIIEHILSFYEYVYGVLPLDANLATLLPRAGFADQRAARVTFESPQTGETIVTELRFPTSNRGGFVAGLEQFFADNLVPGAVLTLERTERPNHFLLEYFQVSGEDRKLLHLDERKGKYAFRSMTYYCATQDDFLLTEGRFPKLADVKPLDDRARRRPEQVVQVTFERVGENTGSADAPSYSASFSDLLAAANIERPISAEYLRDILTSGTYPEFSADESGEDVYIFQPVS